MRTRDHAKTPPINGVFPLDRGGACAETARLYVACVRAGGACAALARAYLDCRRAAGLMSSEDHAWSETLNDSVPKLE